MTCHGLMQNQKGQNKENFAKQYHFWNDFVKLKFQVKLEFTKLFQPLCMNKLSKYLELEFDKLEFHLELEFNKLNSQKIYYITK